MTQSKSLQQIKGKAIALTGNDIDTDRIIPARFMRCVSFEGLGQYAFYDVRFDKAGKPRAHPLNDPQFKGHSILIVNKNFGCGSSREHAPQSLAGFGIRALIGESFADIFAGNCATMGIPAVSVDENAADALMNQVQDQPDISIEIDLQELEIRAGDQKYSLSMPDAYRSAFLQGAWDTTEVLQARREKIIEKALSLPYMNDFAD